MAAGVALSGAPSMPAHSQAFKTRRFLNWFPLGLSYAFLYMGRYNLNVAKGALGPLMTPEDFGIIFAIGTLVYGVSFLANGPLTDRLGGRKAMLLSALGAAVANLAMGLYLRQVASTGSVNSQSIRLWFSVLYALNMYFQSFGAVAIVKVNSAWFHLRERGGFSGIFGTMISSGIFLAFSVNKWILNFAKAQAPSSSDVQLAMWVFLVPSLLLFLAFLVESLLLRDRPSDAGLADFETGDGSSAQEEAMPMRSVLWKVFSNPVLLTIAAIEFCTGVVRQGVMQSYPFFAGEVLALPSSHPMRDGDPSRLLLTWGICFAVGAVFFALAYKLPQRRRWFVVSGALVCLAPFLSAGWGGLQMVAGVIGGNVAGYVSDLFFQSRRAPAAGGLYAVLFLCTVAMVFTMARSSPVIAETHVAGLQPGDRILSVAGKGELSDWVAVGQAFASVPASCQGGAVWDAKTSMCSTDPQQPRPDLAVSTGTIALEVERAGQRLTVNVVDKKQKMKAGDRRKLEAVPETDRSPYLLGVVVFIMTLCVIGTHGLLSGTATMDFGGRKGTATAVGMIDGFVYLGTGLQSVALGYLTTRSWYYWPWFLMPFTLVGFLLCLKIWNAKPAARGPAVPAAVGLDPAATSAGVPAARASHG